MQRNGQLFSSLFCLSLTIGYAQTSFAVPFNIIPQVALPTQVVIGGTRIAYYKITNNTGQERKDNFIKYLPPNSKQITTNGTYTNTCDEKFNLAAYGNADDNCILQLAVTGPIDGQDPNTH